MRPDRLAFVFLFAVACGTAVRAPLRDDDPAAAAEYFAMKRAGSADAIASLDTAREAMRAMPRYSTASDRLVTRDRIRAESANEPFESWQFLGPGNIGGRTRVLVIDPGNPSVMFAGGVSGGLWKTETAGLKWTPIADDLANIAINSLVMHPTDSRILYAGTGEGYFREEVRGTGLPLRGNGIFVTKDAGATWTRLPSTTSSDFHWVNDLVISRHDPSRIYAATRTGVWRSDDAGGTWKRILATNVKGGCLDLAHRTDAAGDYLFASCGTLDQAAVYRNPIAQTDGSYWIGVLSETGMGRTSLAIAPSNQDIVYAMAANMDTGRLFAVYRSGSSGEPGSWQKRANGQQAEYSGFLLENVYSWWYPNCAGGQRQQVPMGWYCNTLAVDPLDPERLWAGGVDLFRSDDGGSHWGIASYWWPGAETRSFNHADQHAIVFHPDYDGDSNRTVYFANDGGVYRTDDARATPATGTRAPCDPGLSSFTFTPLNNSYGVTQFYDGAVYPDGRTWIGVTQDNGTVVGRIDEGPDSWDHVLGGDGTYVAVDQLDPRWVYSQTQNGNVYRSSDGGRTFQSARSGLSDQFLFVTPMEIDPNQPARLWIAGKMMWRTENRASSWVRASAPLPAQVSAIAIANGRPNRVIAGTIEGHIARSDAALNASFSTPWGLVQPREGFVSSVAFDPADPSIAYATYAGFGGVHVWRSLDGGLTWAALDGSGAGKLPDIPVHSLAVDPTRRERIYLGTDLGVFVSLDWGETWNVENTGYASVVTEALVIGQGALGPAVYAFTHGRGAWRAELTVRGPKRRAVR